MVIKPCKSDRIFDTTNVIFMLLCIIVVAYPLIFIVSASFSDPAAVNSGEMKLIPIGFTLEGYKTLFRTKAIWTGYKNTIIYTAFGTILQLFFNILCGYAVSRKDFMLRGFVLRVFTITMFFGGGLIPTYLLVKNLGMLNSMWAMIVPGAVSTYNMIMCRSFFEMNIPNELLEASEVDGCGDFRFFVSVVLPLSGALIAVMVLFFAVGHWNTYFNGLIYLTDKKKFSLQMVLQEILVDQSMNNVDQSLVSLNDTAAMQRKKLADSIKYGVIIVGSLPVLVLYPFVQKYFVKGVMVGSLKG